MRVRVHNMQDARTYIKTNTYIHTHYLFIYISQADCKNIRCRLSFKLFRYMYVDVHLSSFT